MTNTMYVQENIHFFIWYFTFKMMQLPHLQN